MAGIKVLAFFSFSVVFLTFASAKSNPGLWYEFQPRFQEPPVVPFGPQLPEGRLIGVVTNIALRTHYESRLKTMEKTVTDLEDLVNTQQQTLDKLNKEANSIDALILELQEAKCDEPKNHTKGDRPYKTPTPIIIYTYGPSKGHYGSYGQPELEPIYPVKGHYIETDHYPHKMDHYGETDDYDKPKGHYEVTNDYDKPKEHYEKSDDYDKPKGHYGKSETQTNGSSKREDENPIESPKQKNSEGKSFADIRFDGYDGHAQQEGDFYTQYYPSRYRNGKELKSEPKNVKESLKESSEKSSKEQKKS